MYSVVLMTALAAGGASADCHLFGGHGGCNGGYGCYGYCGGCYGCSGYGCSGCYGGGYGCWSSCSGCYGGWGYGCWSTCGCSGGWGYGCWSAYDCHGCYGCYGWSCSGCAGCWGGYYSPYHPLITDVMPGAPVMPGTVAPEGQKEKGKTGTTTETSQRATLVVELPADARLFVDDVAMKTTSARRVFVTPPLQQGQVYYYELKAEMQRDGQPVTVSGRVVIRPGQEVRASLTESSPNGTFVVRYNNEQ